MTLSSHQTHDSVASPDFSGLWIPLVTPFHAAGDAVDHAALQHLIHRLRDTGIAGLVACGSTGEAAALSQEEQDAVLATTLKAAQGLPVVMGLSGYHLGQMLERVQALNAQPLAALLVPPPHYIRPSQQGLLQWFTAIANASAHPLIIYDIPYRTGVQIEWSCLKTLAQHPRICAIKDCGGDAYKTQSLLADPRWQVLAGEDMQIFSSLAQGGHGAIAASAHGHTAMFVHLISLIKAGELRAAQVLWQTLTPYIADCFAEPNPAPIKAWLSAQGLMSARLRAPMTSASPALAQRVSAHGPLAPGAKQPASSRHTGGSGVVQAQLA